MTSPPSATPALLAGIGRAFGGALLFSLPILMTMEMWRLAVVVPRVRLGLLVMATVALTVALSHYFGFLKVSSPRWRDAALDAGIAVLVGAAAAGTVLAVLSVVDPLPGWRETVSVVAIETLPAAVGASFARSQLGQDSAGTQREPGYTQELFLMTAGAVVFAANIAPTEEVVLLASRMGPVHGLLTVVLAVGLMHAFVYRLGFRGGSAPGGIGATFAAFTLVGYVLAWGVSAYLLWTFGRFDGLGLYAGVMQTVVLALPASLGAAAARLIL